MFLYDPSIAAAIENPPQTIPEVLAALRSIDSLCQNTDGLKWFNWLYLSVTEAVENRVAAGGFSRPAWLADLDVRFARLYFNALHSALTGGACPGCWDVFFRLRDHNAIARIQFALAGINAHINHDLCLAVDATCRATGTAPSHGTPEYADYTSVNSTLDALIDMAKSTLNVRLPGDPLPAVSQLENTLAAWNVEAAREAAWCNAEHLWSLPPSLGSSLTDTIDGFTTVIGKTLLVPVG